MRRSQGTEEDTEPTTQAQTEAEAERSEERNVRWMRHYGDRRDKTHEVEEHLVRIMTQNINTFPKLGTIKQDRMKHEMKMNTVTGMSELNKNWSKIPATESFYNRTKHWWRMPKIQTAWLYDPDWPSQYKQGGVAIAVQGHLAPYVQDKGGDESGLGRWAWVTVEGRSEIKTAIIQIYRPCRNSDDTGSVYNQQQVWTETQDPIASFDTDLLSLIDTFREGGHRIIVMGDFNIAFHHSRRNHIEKALEERDIINPITERYGRDDAPNTHTRGSLPIDAIFCSQSIDMIMGGFEVGMDEISDHRAIWMDITMDSILGVDRGKFQKPLTRKLQIRNKKVTQKFNRALDTQITQHRMVEKAERLLEVARTTKRLTPLQARQYETLDDQRCRAIAYANQRCTKLPSDDADFSPTLQEAIGIATLQAEMARKIRTQRKIHTRWVQRMRKRWKIQHQISIPSTAEEAAEALKAARTQVKEVKQKAPDLRRDFLDMLISQAEDEGNQDKAKELRTIRDQEKMRETHARIKLAQGKIRGGGVKFVERHNDDGTRTTIKDKDKMEQEIMEANEKKLHSADESPLRQGELKDILSDHDYSIWEAFLDGQVALPEKMEEGTRRWLENILALPTKDRPMEVTMQEYVHSWTKPREHTACAPGPMHYGTFKAMRWSRNAAKLHTIMANIPILTGYTPKRWTQCVDSMLPKKKDEWRPSKLRLTALLMPDFNHNNKILGRKAMAHAEADGTLAMEQYGSRKCLSASKHALNKRIVLDIIRAQRRPAVICANDAKACYDRILHFAAYVSLRKAGLTKEATISMLEPIRRLTHRIRTAYGDSTLTYGGDEWDRDPSGICQGNGAGPAIWALVSSPLLKTLRDAGYGAKLHAAIGDTFIHLCGFAFVDDADTIQTGELTDTMESVVLEAQAQLKLWEEGIRATGGGIEGSKSDFAVADFRWQSGQWRYAPMDTSHKLWVPDGKGGREYLTQLPYSTARRTLGVWQAVDGNEKKQTAVMKEKARKWSRNVRTGFLSRDDIVFGIKTSLYPSLTYGLMATALTRAQCHEVFKPIRTHALGPMGYNTHMPAEVVHGPVRYGGMGLKDIYTVQGIEHVKALLDEITSNSPTGHLLRIIHQEHQLESGRSSTLYDTPYDEIADFLTPSWVTSTLEFVSEAQIRVEGDLPTLHKWRERDVHLMDAFRETPGHTISTDDLKAANRCRMYLRAVTQSDIADGEGKGILKSAWEVKHDWCTTSEVAYRWPRQERPSRGDIRRWQKVIQATFGVTDTHPRWAITLGPWTSQANKHLQWWYDKRENHLYQLLPHGWKRWRKLSRRTRTRAYTLAEDTDTHPPARAMAAIVTISGGQGHKVYLEGVEQETTCHMQPNEAEDIGLTHPVTLLDYLKDTDTSLHWALEDIKLPSDEGLHLATQIASNTLELICDGSLKDLFGTSAGFPIGVRQDLAYKVYNRVPGDDTNQCSYRSELCGILAHILVITAIAKRHGLSGGTVTIGCDNEPALWATFGMHPPTTGDSCFDLIRTIWHHLQQSKVVWKHRHVKGHQDDLQAHEELDHWAKANIEADDLAKAYWRYKYTNHKIRPRPPRMPGEGWRLRIGHRIITQNVDEEIYNHRYKHRMGRYWVGKGRIAESTMDRVDWNLYEATIRITPWSKIQWTQKHFSGFEATNYMLHKFGERMDDRCPRCDTVERHTHILQCKEKDATVHYDKLRTAYDSWLQQTTSNWIREAVLEQLDAYRHQRPVTASALWPEEVQDAVSAQNRIGDRSFVEGCLHANWEKLQDDYLLQTHSRRSPRRWVKELILKTWMISWDMWDHRNRLVHGHKETKKEQLIAALDAEIRDIHQFGTQHRFLPRVAKNFFKTPLENVLKKTEYQKRVWQTLGNRYLAHDRKRMTNRSAVLMREWLIPGSSEGRRKNKIKIRDTLESRASTGGT